MVMLLIQTTNYEHLKACPTSKKDLSWSTQATKMFIWYFLKILCCSFLSAKIWTHFINLIHLILLCVSSAKLSIYSLFYLWILKTRFLFSFFSATNPQNYFSKRDRLCGEIFLEYTVQRFDFIKEAIFNITLKFHLLLHSWVNLRWYQFQLQCSKLVCGNSA